MGRSKSAAATTNLVPQPKRTYNDEDRIYALAALDLYGGNIHRTAIALGIPVRTLRDWADNRTGEYADARREKRGDLATKLESKMHDVVESITPDVIHKATLSQRGVFLGIGIDKIRALRGSGLEPDTTAELCKLLNCNERQLPERLELGPGESWPSGQIIDVTPEPQPEPILRNDTNPIVHASDCDLQIPCSCGAHQDIIHRELETNAKSEAQLLDSVNDDDKEN